MTADKRNKQEVEKKIKYILAQNLKIDSEKITLDSSLVDDLGMDSFASIETMFEMEQEFGIDIPEDGIAEVKTVKDILTYISSRLETSKKQT